MASAALDSMDCKNCELKKQQFYCENCLRSQQVFFHAFYIFPLNQIPNSLLDFHRQMQHFATDRDEQVSKASKALDFVGASHLRRANVSSCQDRAEEVLAELEKLRKSNEKSVWQSSIVYLL
jgi:hypothetical protein